MKRVRWPTRNPMGDTLNYRALATYGSVVTLANASSSVDIIPTTQFNNMAVLGALFGEAPGLRTAAASYERYRITGITVKHTVWPVGSVGDVPLYLYTNGGAFTADVPVPSITTTPELRWSKSRLVNIPSTGGKPTSISTYYNVRKVNGPDSIVTNDVDFTASTGAGAPSSWSGAAIGPRIRTGLYTMSGAPASQGQQHSVKTTLIMHIKFFQRKILVQ